VILRSVVGKLWLTIIILVALVLTLLSLFLNQQVERSYVQDQQISLNKLADVVQRNLNSTSVDTATYVANTIAIAKQFNTQLVILDKKGNIIPVFSTIDATISKELITRANLPHILSGNKVVAVDRVDSVGGFFTSPFEKNDVFLIGVPYKKANKIAGAILLYQTKDQLSVADIKHWIFYSALIGIALTTVFAFFLSTRITQPLIQMQKAAEKVAFGQFSARVRVRPHERDEIADLAITFNRMARQLEESINLLSHEKEQLTSILRSMTDGVLTLSASGKVIVTNPPAEKFLSLFGNASSRLLPLPLESAFGQVLEEEKEFHGDVSEQGRAWAVVIAPLYARDQVRGAVAVLRDVTDERLLNKFRKDFVANVSHELRTPLSMLQGYSEALLDDIAETPEVRREIAQVINDESQRMGRLVSQLLDLARMEAGFIDLEPIFITLRAFIDRVCRKFSNLAEDQKVTLANDFHEPLPEVFWDADKVEQILTNLIGNAIRHTPEAGKVTVRILCDKQNLVLDVEDTGTGIPEEDLPFVFERFYKADKARKRDTASGTGLGLSIVKHLVKAHQGKISVRSKVGVGTTFSVRLPIEVSLDGLEEVTETEEQDVKG
jgi:two-component system, OmpR family, sensor histidine kinase ResE